MEASVLKFWRDYVKSLPAGLYRQKMPADVFAFGESRELADRLAMLVLEGVKMRLARRSGPTKTSKSRRLKKETILSFSMGTAFG